MGNNKVSTAGGASSPGLKAGASALALGEKVPLVSFYSTMTGSSATHL
jgi:hypothetical protein